MLIDKETLNDLSDHALGNTNNPKCKAMLAIRSPAAGVFREQTIINMFDELEAKPGLTGPDAYNILLKRIVECKSELAQPLIGHSTWGVTTYALLLKKQEVDPLLYHNCWTDEGQLIVNLIIDTKKTTIFDRIRQTIAHRNRNKKKTTPKIDHPDWREGLIKISYFNEDYLEYMYDNFTKPFRELIENNL